MPVSECECGVLHHQGRRIEESEESKKMEKEQKKSQRREALAFITHIFLWCPVREENPQVF
jgi:hypothetical protein